MQQDLFGGGEDLSKIPKALRDYRFMRFALRDGTGTFTLDLRSGQLVDAGKKVANEELTSAYLIFRDIVENNGAGFRYVARSAMHKEIRRGDVAAAVVWSRLNTTLEGASKTKQYVKSILLEETRNLDLATAFHSVSGKTPEAMVALIASSRKKWELPSTRAGLWDVYMRGYALARNQGGTPTPEEITTAVKSNDALLLFTTLWRCRLGAELSKQLFFDAGLAELRERGFAHVDGIEARKSDVYYVTSTVAEVLGGGWDASANEILGERMDKVPLATPGVIEIPALYAYVYDKHTRPGKREMIKHLRDHHANTPQPGNLDMRWAGTIRGNTWRFAAFKQAGLHGYVDAPWESIRIEDYTWRCTVSADAHFSEKLYGMAGVRVDHKKLLEG